MANKIDQSVLYQTQISLSEWFEGIEHSQTEELRLEDNEKRERLKKLNELIGLPFDKPTKFFATDLSDETDILKKFLQDHGDELCALRLIPGSPKLPKLRIRGCTVLDSLKWFAEQKIKPRSYRAEFIPHSENQLWATTFIINQHGIFGEITKGGHFQLTQGFYDEGEPIAFSFNFKLWSFSKQDNQAQEQIKEIVALIRVSSKKLQQQLEKDLEASFSHNFLQGYFEALITREHGLWYIDYNRILGQIYSEFSALPINKKLSGISGYPASNGKIQGKACVVTSNNMDRITLSENDILICQMTTPDYLPLMKKAGAVVTDLGGILSHAAIICREMGKPCITNTKTATKVLKTGDLIEVDADLGVIKKIANAN